jgi:hypothetical protein
MSHSEDASLTPSDDSAKESLRGLHPELQSFEARLAKLSPRDDRLDRERLAFLAGQASLAAGGADLSAHDWRRHPGWPAAFAAMTALAATLLAMLIIRPAVTNGPPTASRDIESSDRFGTTPQRPLERTFDGIAGALTAGDAIHGDIEQLLAAPAQERAIWPDEVLHDTHPALTPAGWQRVSDELQPHAPPAGSSSFFFHRGTNS